MILTLFLLASAALGGGAKRDLVHIDVPDMVEVRAGQNFEVPIKFWVADGYHINSNKPTEEYMIPTRIEWQPSAFKHVSDDFPPPDQREFKFTSGKKLSVYEGARTLKARFTAPAGSTGKQTIEGAFRYQACDNAACYPPNKVEIKLNVNVSGR